MAQHRSVDYSWKNKICKGFERELEANCANF